MKEFRVIDAAHSEEQLRLRLKPNELEEYGEAFTPDFVYEVIRQLPRFRDMQVSLLFTQTDRVICSLIFFISEVTSRTLKNSWDSFWRKCTKNAFELRKTPARQNLRLQQPLNRLIKRSSLAMVG
jgi:hypothetical protein